MAVVVAAVASLGVGVWAALAERHHYKHACEVVPAATLASELAWHGVGHAEEPERTGTKSTLCWFRSDDKQGGRAIQVFQIGHGSREAYDRALKAVLGNKARSAGTRVLDRDGYRAFVSSEVDAGQSLYLESLFVLVDGEYVNVNLENFPERSAERLIPAIVANLE